MAVRRAYKSVSVLGFDKAIPTCLACNSNKFLSSAFGGVSILCYWWTWEYGQHFLPEACLSFGCQTGRLVQLYPCMGKMSAIILPPRICNSLHQRCPLTTRHCTETCASWPCKGWNWLFRLILDKIHMMEFTHNYCHSPLDVYNSYIHCILFLYIYIIA